MTLTVGLSLSKFHMSFIFHDTFIYTFLYAQRNHSHMQCNVGTDGNRKGSIVAFTTPDHSWKGEMYLLIRNPFFYLCEPVVLIFLNAPI